MIEVHLTLLSNILNDHSEWIKTNGWKPVTVVGDNLNDVMLSKRFSFDEFIRIDGFSLPFDVIRFKFESSLDEPEVPNMAQNGCYFESHIEYICNSVKYEYLKKYISIRGVLAHLSKNKFKVIDDSRWSQMVTIRANSAYDLGRKVDEFRYGVRDEYGLNPEKIQSEYVFFDSNKSHDDRWTEKDTKYGNKLSDESFRKGFTYNFLTN